MPLTKSELFTNIDAEVGEGLDLLGAELNVILKDSYESLEAADVAEAAARDAADDLESAARIAADSAEATARQENDEYYDGLRAAGDAALLANAEAEAIQLLRLHNPDLVWSGFVNTGTPKPTSVLNNAYIATATGAMWDIAGGVTKGQVIKGNGTIFIAEPINLNKFAFKNESTLLIDGKINICSYIHPNGDAEYVGNGTTPADTQSIALYTEPQGKAYLVRRIKAKFYVTADFTGTVNIYKGTAKLANPTNHTLLTSVTYGLNELSTDSNSFNEIILPSDLVIGATEYLYIYVIPTTGNARMRYWNAAGSPTRNVVIWKYAGTWATVPGYYETPLLVYSDFDIKEVIDKEQTDIDSLDIRVLTIETDVSIVRLEETTLQISDVRINPLSYKHSRGDAEYVGSGNLTGLDATCVALAPQGKRMLVKAIKAKVYTTAPFIGTMAVYKSTVYHNNNTLNTLVELFDLASGEFNEDENEFQTITLSNDLILEANEYLYFYAFSNTPTLAMRRWATEAGSAPYRQNLIYKYAGAWTTANAAPFLGVPMIVYSDVEDMSTLSAKVTVLESSLAGKMDEDYIEVNLPDTIYAIVGDKLQLYYIGIIKAVNPYNYHVLVNCTKGNQYPRYFEYTPVLADVGTVTFTITVKNNSGKTLGTKTCNLITKNTVQSPAALKSILSVGDSLTTNGAWAKEASRRLIGTGGTPAGKALSNISFIGRKNDGGAVGWEGTGGWDWNSYIIQGGLAYRFTVSGVVSVPAWGYKYTNNGQTFTIAETNITGGSGTIRCTATGAPAASGNLTLSEGYGDATIAFSSVETENLNPFWNDGALDFQNYVDSYMSGACDAIYILLSWNSLSANKTDFSSIITTAKTLIDHIHSVYPSCKIKLMGIQMPSLNGGMGYAYGANGGYADTYGMVKTVLNLNEAYQDWCNESAYSSFMEFVNVSSQFDSENNMPEADKAVNSRSTKTEKIGTNGVHPSTEGYYQIADIVFRNVVANFCQ